jgi:hypothetical protein
VLQKKFKTQQKKVFFYVFVSVGWGFLRFVCLGGGGVSKIKKCFFLFFKKKYVVVFF